MKSGCKCKMELYWWGILAETRIVLIFNRPFFLTSPKATELGSPFRQMLQSHYWYSRTIVSISCKPQQGRGNKGLFCWKDKEHDEFFKVVSGRILYKIGSSERVYTNDDGKVTISRGIVHCLRTLPNQECVLLEGSNPVASSSCCSFLDVHLKSIKQDWSSELFYRNLLDGVFHVEERSLICSSLHLAIGGYSSSLVKFCSASFYGDTYLALPGRIGFLEDAGRCLTSNDLLKCLTFLSSFLDIWESVR